MKIAFFIGIHKDTPQFGRLIRAIYRDGDHYFVHIDEKQSQTFCEAARAEVSDLENVHFIERVSVTWAGWSQCEMELAAFKQACNGAYDWDYWINLSGQDYPIKPIGEIAAFLAARPGTNFIDSREVSSLGPRLRQIVKRRYEWLALEWGGRTRRLPVPTGPILASKLTTYGSSWHMLSRDYCDWVANGGDEKARLMRFTKSSDEFLHQYLISISPFAQTLDLDNRRFYIFDGKPNPDILTLDHFDQLAQSPAFFARKFDPEQSQDLVRRIDQELLQQDSLMENRHRDVETNSLRVAQ